jgi:hypothetical protein
MYLAAGRFLSIGDGPSEARGHENWPFEPANGAQAPLVGDNDVAADLSDARRAFATLARLHTGVRAAKIHSRSIGRGCDQGQKRACDRHFHEMPYSF